jgi:hypothetical protein
MRLINATVLTAFAAGLAGGLLAPVLAPVAARNARPAAKRAIRAGLAAYERGCQIAAEWTEATSDLLAEVQAERTGQLGYAPGSGEPRADSIVPLAGPRPDSDHKAHA